MANGDSDTELLYGGECPVCGDEFECGFNDISEGEQVDGAKICVIEKSDDGAEMASGIIHLPQDDNDSYPDFVLKSRCLGCQRVFYPRTTADNCPYCGSEDVYDEGNGVVCHNDR